MWLFEVGEAEKLHAQNLKKNTTLNSPAEKRAEEEDNHRHYLSYDSTDTHCAGGAAGRFIHL